MTPVPAPSNPFTALMKRADLIFTGGLFLTVLLLIMPIPTVLLDLFLALNIGLSLLVAGMQTAWVRTGNRR